MPDALIVIDATSKDKKFILNELVKRGIVKRTSVKGVTVYGRHYLTGKAIREAYQKKLGII